MKWAEVVKRFPEANILQSPEYGKANELIGEKVIRENFGGQGWGLLIVRNARRGRYLEIPCGPLIDWQNAKVVQIAMATITTIAQREKCAFVRLRPQLLATPENLKLLENLGLKRAPMHLAAEHTVMIDLTPTPERLLAGMRRQTRYEVRRAEKLGIRVEKRRDEAIFREFHRVQLETAHRQGFVPPDLKTLLAEREAFGAAATVYVARTPKNSEPERVESGSAELKSAKPKDARPGDAKPRDTGAEDAEPDAAIAYGLILRSGHEGDYYEAASTPLNQKLPGADAVLWQAMQDLRADGYQRFNLWGIAPAGDPHHRYAGVTTFKKGFGGEAVEYVPAHDLVISSARYAANWVVETTRRKRRHL